MTSLVDTAAYPIRSVDRGQHGADGHSHWPAARHEAALHALSTAPPGWSLAVFGNYNHKGAKTAKKAEIDGFSSDIGRRLGFEPKGMTL